MLSVITDLENHGHFLKEDKKPWTDAAALWRLPYWDWALDKSELPEIYQDVKIEIRLPVGNDGVATEAVTNPLYRFQLFVGTTKTRMGDLPKPYNVSAPDVSSSNNVMAS